MQTEAASIGNSGSQESAKHTVEDLLDRYADELLDSFAANERRNRVRQLGCWWEPLGHLTLGELTPAVISEAMDWRPSRARPGRRPSKDSGVENFRFYDLRHSCASYLAMAGATIREIQEIQEILGHKSIQMTMRYSHPSEQHLGAAADRMAEKFLSRVS